MSVELEDAKTKVAQFQKQCEEYLVIIVGQKREADEQQKVGLVTIRASFRENCMGLMLVHGVSCQINLCSPHRQIRNDTSRFCEMFG
ncbi:hypothetical protein DPMN_184980 [Dreissena polymorpha]|uniref:Uncharacterized protein n=1 Tax=Dreissena polymorpha TaxID=45954 RepID=A0A9D4DLW6_DREPO|nr:hypothetical protein DPMN_184980 [Dreissena polymorpha]